MRTADRTPLAALRLLAVDVETSGLVAGHDRIVALGWVPVDGRRVDLAGARRRLVRDEDPGGAVTIHGLTHDDLAAGVPLREAVGELREALAGRALLAHHAPFDVRFLAAASEALREDLRGTPVVCTLRLQRRLLTRRGEEELPRGALRLWQSRRRFGLPDVPAHDALGDALACAELYLAQVAELEDGGSLALRDVRLRRTLRERLRVRWRRWRRRGRGPREVLSAGSR